MIRATSCFLALIVVTVRWPGQNGRGALHEEDRDMARESSPHGVIFDMDGVLVDSGPAHMRSWQALAREYAGMVITPEQFAASFGQRSSEIIRAWFGVDDPAEVRRLDDRKEAIYRELIRSHVPVMPGAMQCVRKLHEAGIRLAVGSSGPPENVELVCGALRLERYLSAVVTAVDVQRGKPDPQVFEVAAARLDLPCAACFVVEDAPPGVEAAKRAGMVCIALAGTHGIEALRAANRIVRSLTEITPELLWEVAALARLER